MIGELVYTTTDDLVRLHGFYSAADCSPVTSPAAGDIDAAVLIHGLGGNFYSSRLLTHFSQTLLSLGVSVVIVNTRGHDMINSSSWGGRTRSVGAALENVGDSKFDLSAWTDFMVGRGHKNVVLFGHSLGAIKSLYAQAYQPNPNVRSIIGLSATRLGYHKLIETPRGELFRETIEKCGGLIENGIGEIPIKVMFPFPTWMTPQCYLEKYGPGETYNWMKFIGKVQVPTLLLFGQRELDEDPAFEGVREELENLNAMWSAPTVEIIEEADHFYSAKFERVDDVITRWLTR